MLAPKKGLLCNLNHIHLQHISLGLHLSRHPELQESSVPTARRDQTDCGDCQENCGQVDANSNNPSLKCQCCESHVQLPVKLGLQNQTVQEDFPCLHTGEDVASPCDPASTSSSVSSCSDFSLDDSPVSVYCKEFTREESQYSDNQPNIIPIEDAQEDPLLAEQGHMCDGGDASLDLRLLPRPDIPAEETPDSLCSSSSLDSQYDEPSPNTAMPETLLPPPSVCADLDPNCNTLLAPPVPGRWDHNLNAAPEQRPRSDSVPPPVPPRPRRGLQALARHEAEQPALPEKPADLEHSLAELCRDVGKKTITSFHELAQKRKRNATGPALAQARSDRSDWLIIFSPDTELPPRSELVPSTLGQDPPQHQLQLQPEQQARPPSSRQREVTTFKELRYRSAFSKHKGQPAGEQREAVAPRDPPAPLEVPRGSSPSSSKSPSGMPPAPPRGQLPAPGENHQLKRRTSRLGLQSIAEGQLGGVEEAGLLPESCLPGRKGPGPVCNKEALVWRPGGPGRDPWVPGKVERGDGTCKEAGRAPPAAAAPGPDPPGLADADRAQRPPAARKRALLVAVSASVDKIVAHFSAARNLVQKAQLGDSWLSPDVGYLLLHTLCPALYALVEDGLKPFQKDVITGQRKNSPWSVVEASVKPGPSTHSLHSLCWHVSRLAPLNSARQRFHAFILGLLNIKQLELWISHLQKSPGVISMLYFPTAFFALSQGPLPHLADELLLLIQPLSVLTFHLDLLFEHHHLSVDVRPLSHQLESPPCPAHRPSRRISLLPAQAQGVVQPHLEGPGSADGASLECEIPHGHPGRAALRGAEGSTRSQAQAAVPGPFPSPQVGAALQQTLQNVLRWGDQLSRAFLGADTSPEYVRQGTGPQDAGGGLSSWWDQLSQASRIYVAPSKEGFPFIRWTKLRMAAGNASPGQTAQPQASANEPRGTELQLLQTKAVTECPSADPISSTDNSRASSPEDLFLPAGARTSSKPAAPAAGEKLLSASSEPCADGNQAALSNPTASRPPGPEKGSWLGRLFGATCPSARGFPLSPDTTSTRSRRPSSWLSPSMTVLAAVMKGRVPEKTCAQEQPVRKTADPPQTHRAVRALCDHVGAGAGHLSFRKGDILQLLSTVDEDWICCCYGSSTGLVPVGYTSLVL
ncbi:AP-4 complex accessory subunit RUSC1 isoform X1 [Apteryx mantelli]|uniref:AP-4 complex accessory subunit RUSC1 isoform X1 n=1 Tax=Apteryx mantelli TaxID=2696672 RepID=A0ABM4FWL1_9AVES